MTESPGTRDEGHSERWKRALYGAAASLALFVVARLIAGSLYPIDSYPLANQLYFMGAPFLGLTFFFRGISFLGLQGANVINAIFWVLLGGAVALLVRRPLAVVAVWLLVVGVGSALVFGGLVLGMMSSSP
jgi:hypothetical protein